MVRRLPALALGMFLAGCHDVPPNPTSPTPGTGALVTPTAIQIVIIPGQLPVGGGTAEISISTTAANGATVAPAVAVRLSADGGELSATNVTTDRTGHGKVTWTGTNRATVTAEAGALTQTAAIVVADPFVPPPAPAPTPRPPAPEPLPPLPPIPPQPVPLPDPVVLVTLSAAPQPAGLSEPVTLTAHVSTNLTAGLVTQYEWVVPGFPPETTVTNTKTVSYTTIGQRLATVTARTANGTHASDDVTFTVTAPALAVNVTASALPHTAGAPVTFTATVTASSGPVPTVSYRWDFDNDGNPESFDPSPQSQSYAAGTYTARVTVTAPDGRSATNTRAIVVTP